MKKGFLISFEGGEACGKTTQIQLFEKELERRNLPFVHVREPGGTEIGEKIRELLLHEKAEISSQTEFLLFSASRSELVQQVIRPALNAGKIVVMDRFFDSSFAYQGYGGKLKLQDIESVTNFATGGIAPSLTFLLDVTYEIAFARKNADAKLKNLDRIESKGKDFHNRVRSGYLEIAKNNPDRVFVIDAAEDVLQIQSKILEEFDRRFAQELNGNIQN